MTLQLAFAISVAMAFLTWTLVAVLYVWPWLRRMPRRDALRPILLLHSTRFVGLGFLVPGVVSPQLSSTFTHPAAFGDLAAAVLALLALATLRSPLGLALTLAFNVLGSVDLIYAYYAGNLVGVAADPGLLGAMYFVPTLVVPLLLVTHVLAFLLIFGKDPATAPRQAV